MGPKKRGSQSQRRSVTQKPAYDPNMPENWTVVQLKSFLNRKRIEFAQGSKRSRLVTLCKQHRSDPDQTDLGHDDRVARHLGGNTHNAPLAADGNGVVMSAIHELSSTLGQIQNNMKDMTARINHLEGRNSDSSTNDNASSGNINIVPPGGSNVNVSETLADTSGSTFTLSSALAAHCTPNPAHTQNSALAHNYVKTKYGFAAESLPFVETVSPSLRRQIIEGKDINLASLLIPYYTGPNLCDTTDKSKPDPRLQKILTIGEFIQAFGIYKSIMCEPFPQRRQELDLYERDIIDMASKYGGSAFYTYHKLFSAKAAAHLRYQNIPVDWSIRNNTLFCDIFADQRPNSCSICQDVTHSSGFCPKLLTQGSERRPERNSDVYGRPKVYHLGKEVCNNFNGEKGCSRPRCNNLHVCLTCKQEHPRYKCSEAKNGSQPLKGARKSNQ